ncbi:TonB-dependent receptor [Limnoglobus roseus]|uniref:Vitamin B12 transporter BtuB n=1 Tax=Limnoglobus roseus TaxID=2598579 RepID=A0A5C1AQM7_9BACT|nr:TonB-dependent receptor [Limnoglobus roseus]QEL20042.1 Vitamin B12 transporter BtuB [Limnoglobus roseus]
MNINAEAAPGQQAPAVSAAGGQQPAQALNAPDLSGLLSKSDQASGVEVSRRNAIVSDPRLRGLRNGQYYALGDGVPYFPGRLDLDTPVSKFYPAQIRDVQVIRGPYTTLLGPAFGYININTLNTPRAQAGSTGTEYHGSTALGYQVNGSQYNGLQVVSAAGSDWGFRGSYNVLQGSDYHAGNGIVVPSSYQANNFSAGLGFDLRDDLSIEIKAIRSFQNNLEFPGLYFDVDTADTEAYSTRILARNFGPFDQATADLWYNTTASSGNTKSGSKQAFVNRLLNNAFNQPFITPAGTIPGGGYQLYDQSTTRFGERSIGYRLAGQWGNLKDELTVTLGTDLNVFGQGLTENIQILQGPQPAGLPPIPTSDGSRTLVQTQSIPNSESVNPGLFLESFLPIGESIKLKSGARIDGVRTTSDPRLITGNIDLFGQAQGVPGSNRLTVDPSIYSTDPAAAQRGLSREFLLLAAFATMDYKVSDTTTLFLGYGYSERAPTLTELYSSGPFIGVLQQGTSRLIGDPNLSKERLNQFDVGLRYDTEYLKAGVSGFYALINDYITYDANQTSGGLTQVVFSNTDLATLAGTEMYLQANVTRWLSPFATLSYVQGIDQTHVDNRRNTPSPNGSLVTSSRRKDPVTGAFATETEPLPQMPPMETRLGIRIHGTQDIPKWQIEFAARIVNGQNAVATSLGEFTTPGFTTFDIRGFWQVRKNFLVTAGVENIGNKLYREHLDPIAANILTGAPALYRPGTNFFLNTQLTY